MAGDAGRTTYRRRAATIEWVNASLRNRNLCAVDIRGPAKLRAVALRHALAHNPSRIIASPAPEAAFA